MNLLSGPRFSVRCRIRESPYYRGFFFLNKMYENFVRTLETVRNGQVSVPRGATVLFPSNLHVLIAEREVVIN